MPKPNNFPIYATQLVEGNRNCSLKQGMRKKNLKTQRKYTNNFVEYLLQCSNVYLHEIVMGSSCMSHCAEPVKYTMHHH